MAKKELLDLYGLEFQEIDGDFSHYTMTVTGDGGVGKSTFAHALYSRFASTVTFGCEDRFKGIRDFKLIPIKDWDTFTKYCSQIKKGLKETGKLPFQNAIIDPIGQLGSFLETSVKEDNGVEQLKDIAFGGGYVQFEDSITQTIGSLRDAGIVVSFVSHGKSEQISPPRQDSYDVQMPDIQKRLKYLVKDEVDFLIYLAKVRDIDEEGNPIEKRRLYLHGYPEFSLKVPLEGFPEYIEWTDNVEEGVDKFIEAFNYAVEYTKNGGSAGASKSKSVTKPDKKVEKIEIVEETEDETLEDSNELETYIELAVETRDRLLEEMAKTEVINILKDKLGTAKISAVKDLDKLKDFIDSYK